MKFKLVDIPHYVPAEAYDEAVNLMINRLSALQGIIAVFQIGGVSNPGISDIDFFVVFENDAECLVNPVRELTGTPSYLFTHNLFGTSAEIAAQIEPFTFFGKYSLIYGQPFDMLSQKPDPDTTNIVGKQVALEYLVKAYWSISSSLQTGIVKTRNVLLHAKALLLDLKLLGIESGPSYTLIAEMAGLRNNWFNDTDSLEKFQKIILPFREAVLQTIHQGIEQYQFYIVPDTEMKIGKNTLLAYGPKTDFQSSGIRIPLSLVKSGRFVKKLQNRFTRSELLVPLTVENIPAVIHRRTTLFREATLRNSISFPSFLPTAFGLNLFKQQR